MPNEQRSQFSNLHIPTVAAVKLNQPNFQKSLFRYQGRQFGFKAYALFSVKYLNANSEGTGDPVRVTKANAERGYSPSQSQHWHYMVVSRSGQFTAWNRYPLEFRYVPEPVGPLAKNRKICCPCRNRIVARSGGLVTTPHPIPSSM